MDKDTQNKVLEHLMQDLQCYLIEEMQKETYNLLKKAYLLGYENSKKENKKN